MATSADEISNLWGAPAQPQPAVTPPPVNPYPGGRRHGTTPQAQALQQQITDTERSQQQGMLDTAGGIASLWGGKAVKAAALAGETIENPGYALSKQGRKKLLEDARKTPAALSEAVQPFGVFQDELGAIASDFQRRGIVPTLHELASGTGDGKVAQLNRDLTPIVSLAVSGKEGPALRGLEQLNRKYMIFNPQQLDALRKGPPGAIATAAQTLRDNPLYVLGASAVTEGMNPVGGALGLGARGAINYARLGARGARAVPGVVERAASAVAKRTPISPPPLAAAKSVAQTIAKTAGHVDRGLDMSAAARAARAKSPDQHFISKIADAIPNATQDVKDRLGRAFNKYYDVERSQIPGILSHHLQHEAGQNTARTMPQKVVSAVFKGLSPEQKIEVFSRAEKGEEHAVARFQKNDPNYVVPEPAKGPSLQERTNMLTAYLDDLDKRAEVAAPPPPPDPNNPLAPRRSPLVPAGPADLRHVGREGTEKHPVFETPPKGEFEPLHEDESGAVMRQNSLGAPTAGFKYEHNTQTLADELRGGRTLHPKFDPAAQVLRDSVARERAIAATHALNDLEKIPIPGAVDQITGNPVNAREGARYYQDVNGQRQIFGSGAGKDAEAAARQYAHREARVAAETRMGGPPPKAFDPARVAGRLEQAKRGVKQAERSAADIAKAVDAVRKATTPTKFIDVLAPQSHRVNELAEELEKNAAARGVKLPNPVALARQMRDEQLQLREDIYNALIEGKGKGKDRRGTIIPDYVWSATAGRNRKGGWVKMGEWEDVPAKFLDESQKPPDDVLPTELTGNRAYKWGNADDVASQLGFDGEHGGAEMLREWMRRNGDNPTIKSNMEAAEKLAATAPKKPGIIPPPVKKAATRVVEGGRKTDQKLVEELVNQQERQKVVGEKAKARAFSTVAKTKTQFDDLKAQLIRARLTTAKRKEYMREYDAIVRDLEADTFKQLEHPPLANARFEPESSLHLGVPKQHDDTKMYIHADAYNALEQAKGMVDEQDREATTALGRFFISTSRLARADIVLYPVVHAIWNLGRAFLNEGGSVFDLNAPDKVLGADAAAMLKAMPGHDWVEPNMTWGEVGERLGALDPYEQHAFGFSKDEPATIRTARYKDLTVGGKFDKLLTEGVRVKGKKIIPGMDDNNWLVFHVFERRYAAALLRKKIVQEGKDVGTAVREVRRALGDRHNITNFEQGIPVRSNLFNFYTWMKTVVPYYAKAGLMNPQRIWVAPTTALRQEREDANDPEADFVPNLWTFDAWQNDDGSFQRIPIPDPARVVEPLAQAARAPIDFFRGETGAGEMGQAEHHEGFSAALEDVQPALNYVRGHVAPIPATALNLFMPRGRYDIPGGDPKATWQQQVVDESRKAAGGFMPSAQDFLENGIPSPRDIAVRIVTGAETYKGHTLANLPNAGKIVAAKRNWETKIRKARDNGDDTLADSLQQQEVDAIAALVKSGQPVQPPPVNAAPTPAPSAAASSIVNLWGSK